MKTVAFARDGHRVLAFSPDGKLLATASADGTAGVWNAETGQAMGPPLRHDGAVQSVAFAPVGTLLLTTCRDGTARF